MATKAQTIKFLNRELKTKAQARGFDILPAQAKVNMAEAAKVIVNNEKTTTPNRP